jgi:hypothetical protein
MGITHDKILEEVASRLGYECRQAIYFDKWWYFTNKETKEKISIFFDDKYILSKTNKEKEILEMINTVVNEMYEEYD